MRASDTADPGIGIAIGALKEGEAPECRLRTSTARLTPVKTIRSKARWCPRGTQVAGEDKEHRQSERLRRSL